MTGYEVASALRSRGSIPQLMAHRQPDDVRHTAVAGGDVDKLLKVLEEGR